MRDREQVVGRSEERGVSNTMRDEIGIGEDIP